jgi:hypothetical protein
LPKRAGNNPKRRIASRDAYSDAFFEELSNKVIYTGSGKHKKSVADYGFDRVNPPPNASLCDGLRAVRKAEAESLLALGIARRMVSDHLIGDLPKYVWAVDDGDEPYEAKLGGDGRSYHGYRLEENERAMRETVLREWRARE